MLGGQPQAYAWSAISGSSGSDSSDTEIASLGEREAIVGKDR